MPEIAINTKICTKCLKAFKLDSFYKSKKGKNGLSSICKGCVQLHGKEYYLNNKEVVDERQRKYYSINKEKVSSSGKKYRIKNKDKINSRGKEYYKNNKEKIRQRQTEYTIKNKDKKIEYALKNKDSISANNKKYWLENKERLTDKQKKYYSNNKDKIKDVSRKYYIEHRNNIRIEQQKYYIENKDRFQNYGIKNKDKIKKRSKKLRDSILNDYDKYHHLLTVDESPRKTNDGYMEIKCTYCGKYFLPTHKMILQRVACLNGRSRGESRLYCNPWCQKSCPTFHKISITPGLKHATSREVQPELRQMVLKRDGYKCVKCGIGIEDAELHCHHIDPVSMNPIESADSDNCVTLCRRDHVEAHKLSWCKTRC